MWKKIIKTFLRNKISIYKKKLTRREKKNKNKNQRKKIMPENFSIKKLHESIVKSVEYSVSECIAFWKKQIKEKKQ